MTAKRVYTDAEVDAIVATHTAIAAAHHVKYTDAEVDAIVATHTAIAAAHHVKYTDAEVDAIVATHTAIAAAHHVKYTDAEVDAIVATHTAIGGAHHSKYLNSEAVAAVLAGDNYVKNIGDAMTGSLTLQPAINNSATINAISTTTANLGVGSKINFQKIRTNGCLNGDYLGFFAFRGYDTNNELCYGCYFMAEAEGDAIAGKVPSKFVFAVMQGNGTWWFPQYNSSKEFDMQSGIIKDPKNHAASALSGTKKLVEIDIGGTPYYFEVYPTKA